MSRTSRAVFVAMALIVTSAPLWAQGTDAAGDGYQLPTGWVISPPPGILSEPSLLTKFAMSTDTAFGHGSQDGWYFSSGNLITGGGWIGGGPGYRRSMFDGRVRLDASAALSWNLYKSAQASIEFPNLARGRLTLGAGARYEDALQVKYSGIGSDTPESDLSAYRFHSADVFGTGRLQVKRWLSIDGRAGWIPQPKLATASGPSANVPNTLDLFTEATAPGLSTQPPFVHGDVSIVADTRDHPGHATTGGMYRAGAAAYVDQDAGTYSFQRYEIEGNQFIPLGTRRWVLGLRGWEVFSNTSAGQVVPFYLMPSLGGHNTLRGYDDYRFHDRDLQSFTAESRLAVLTHMDVTVFADAGKVASEASGLDFHQLKTSYGAGIQFHNATSTLLRLDAGHSVDGWHVFLKLSDSFKRTTPAAGRRSVVPFVD
jgi:hypothetical protein